jgi:hypothetical protein
VFRLAAELATTRRGPEVDGDSRAVGKGTRREIGGNGYTKCGIILPQPGLRGIGCLLQEAALKSKHLTASRPRCEFSELILRLRTRASVYGIKWPSSV